MIWATLLLVVGLAATGIWAWCLSGRQLAATTSRWQWRVLRFGVVVPAGIGFAIAGAGLAGLALTVYDWAVLAVVCVVGLLHLGWLAWDSLRPRKRANKPGPDASRRSLAMLDQLVAGRRIIEATKPALRSAPKARPREADSDTEPEP